MADGGNGGAGGGEGPLRLMPPGIETLHTIPLFIRTPPFPEIFGNLHTLVQLKVK